MFDTTTEAGKRAEARLNEEEISWMTTVRSDRQPQTVPVWFLWDDEGFLIYSQPNRQKLKNISRTPNVGLNLNSNAHGGDMVRLEGTARIDEDARERGSTLRREVPREHSPHRPRPGRLRPGFLRSRAHHGRALAGVVARFGLRSSALQPVSTLRAFGLRLQHSGVGFLSVMVRIRVRYDFLKC